MQLKPLGLAALMAATVPNPAFADNPMTPWGMMNTFGPWTSADVARQEYERNRPHYPTQPVYTQSQLQQFSRPVNHASVEVNADIPDAHVYIQKANATARYDIGIRVDTPKYQAISIVGYPAGVKPTAKNRQLDLNCPINTIRRWDHDRTQAWGLLVASAFADQDTVKMLEKAKTVLIIQGVCHPITDKRGQLAPQGVYEYHLALVSQFEHSNKTAATLEIGTGMTYNTSGNGYFQRPNVQMAFTTEATKKDIRIQYK